MEVTVSLVFLEFGFEFAVVGDFPVVDPPTLRVVSGDVLQFRCGEPALVEVVTHLLVVDDFRSIGASGLQHRTVFITCYGKLYIKSNDWAWNIHQFHRTWLVEGLSAVSPP